MLKMSLWPAKNVPAFTNALLFWTTAAPMLKLPALMIVPLLVNGSKTLYANAPLRLMTVPELTNPSDESVPLLAIAPWLVSVPPSVPLLTIVPWL